MILTLIGQILDKFYDFCDIVSF